MLNLNAQQKKQLQAIGRTEHGKALLNIMNDLTIEVSKIDGIPTGEDYGAQVEGRKLFVKAMNDLTSEIKHTSHRVAPIEHEDYT